MGRVPYRWSGPFQLHGIFIDHPSGFFINYGLIDAFSENNSKTTKFKKVNLIET